MGAKLGIALGGMVWEVGDCVETRLGDIVGRTVGRTLGLRVGVEGLAVGVYVGKVETAVKQVLDPA